MNTEYIIVGNGVAGTEAAKNIRKRDPCAEIMIFTREYYPFYSRPRIPELLAGEVALEAFFVYNLAWYYKNKIHLYLNSVVKEIDSRNKTITLADGSIFTYNKLLLATGSSGVLPPIEGITTAEGVFTLRSVEDTLTISHRATGAKKVTLIGGGLLGIEAGNGLRKLGVSVTIIEMFDRLLPRQLNGEGAAMLQKQMEGMGLTFILGAKSKRIYEKGQTKILELADGRIIESDFILVSAGIAPNITLAKTAGISVNKGILVDNRMETNVPGVYAAGDAAEHKGRVYGIWPAAQRQGVVAGINMSGGDEIYTGTVPSTTLKVAGIRLTSLGDILKEGKDVEQIKRKNPETFLYKELFLKEGIIVGAILLGDNKSAHDLAQLMEKKIDISSYKEEILEPDFDFKGLLK
ncbi:MAG: NAD(P)/FAD-dependent oxidoreductase [Candidatus Brocadia sp.]|nr:Nitrite reductase [NAD(P)H] [Candidatus Brocadia fulgida]MCC6326589.1 NAD(P)/FAD-dependent oxidoreductase [Candidatus Brocadia sp.]